jgi:hypothetical protein
VKSMRLRKMTINASSAGVSTLDSGCFGPFRESSVVRRPLHLATVGAIRIPSDYIITVDTVSIGAYGDSASERPDDEGHFI